MRIEFTVLGKPAPKGSVKAFMAKGARFPIVTHDNKKTKPWCSAVQAAAYEAFHYEGSPRAVSHEPIEIEIDCFFNRPKAHYGTGRNAAKLKEMAPKTHTKKPDVDKLARAILDGMTGIIYHDDSQVVRLRVGKNYTVEQERAIVRVKVIEEGSKEVT